MKTGQWRSIGILAVTMLVLFSLCDQASAADVGDDAGVEKETMFSLIQKGGKIMYPLALGSILRAGSRAGTVYRVAQTADLARRISGRSDASLERRSNRQERDQALRRIWRRFGAYFQGRYSPREHGARSRRKDDRGRRFSRGG